MAVKEGVFFIYRQPVGWMLSRYMYNTRLMEASAVLEVRKQLTYISTVTQKCGIGLKHTSMH